MRFYVHDVLVEETSFTHSQEVFLYHFSLLCSFNQTYANEDIERFSISVGNTVGIQHYLKILESETNKNTKTSFFISEKFFVTKSYNEETIISQLKQIVQGISAKNEKILRIKMMKTFSWEYETFPDIIENLYY